MQVIETVDEHCKHKDCIYRFRFDRCDFCNYIVVEGKPRGCSISECDKYVKGRKEPKMTENGLWFIRVAEEETEDV